MLNAHKMLLVVMTCLIVILPAFVCRAQAKERARPNIVLIMADDMGFECVTANGGQTYQTPHLDKLAKQGVRFTHGYSQPICTPSRVQIMSGLYNSRNYLRFGVLDPETITFANLLQDAGYATCVTGKWQLNGGYSQPPVAGFDGPTNFGFDEYALWQVTRIQNKKPNRFANPGLEINGKAQDFRDGSYGPDIISDYACDFIERQAKADQPFLLYYPMILPHWPFEPTPDSHDWDPDYRKDDPFEKNTAESRNRKSLKHFKDMVAYTDKMVGKILKQLDDAGVRDNTLVIFTGDNGTDIFITSQFNGQPYKGGKGSTKLNGTHVPLIVDWPGTAKPGSVVEDLVDFTDMLPTMLDAAGVPIPKDFKHDGRTFLPQVKGEAGNPRDWIYSWNNSNGKAKQAKEFAMNKRYKLYQDGRLYDLKQDAAESSPIDQADRTEAQRAIAATLKSAIDAHTRKQAPKGN